MVGELQRRPSPASPNRPVPTLRQAYEHSDFLRVFHQAPSRYYFVLENSIIWLWLLKYEKGKALQNS